MFNFDVMIEDVEQKIVMIREAADKYASLALSDAIELQMAVGDDEESAFWDVANYNLFMNWFKNVFHSEDVINITIQMRHENKSIADLFVGIDDTLNAYADAFYTEVERILNAS